jgi:hypothetical protein
MGVAGAALLLGKPPPVPVAGGEGRFVRYSSVTTAESPNRALGFASQ